MPKIIGLTGFRRVGKSTVAGIFREMGYLSVHVFDAGLSMAELYFHQFFGMSEDEAHQCIWGTLKDIPNQKLPSGVTPRKFLELFGRFMGEDLGPAWTLGAAVNYTRQHAPDAPIIIESIVYESLYLTNILDGVLIRIERPGFDGNMNLATDRFTKGIQATYTLINDSDIDTLRLKVGRLISVIEGCPDPVDV